MYHGSSVLDVIEEAREKNNNYETFVSQMEAIKQWNKSVSMENTLRRIYTKYIFRSGENIDEIDILYENVINSINNATSVEELEEQKALLDELFTNKKITQKEYNYLINKIDEKLLEIK